MESIQAKRGLTNTRRVVKVPIVLVAYNRPGLLEKLLLQLRSFSIDHLLVVLDGPKSTEEDRSRCRKVRELIDSIDWIETVDVCAARENMGLRKRVVSGLDWAFTRVSEAIILEDDCIPSKSFIGFCSYCLERYKGDDRVWTICGQNLQQADRGIEDSYYLSSYAHCWGWATWKDRWDRNTFKQTDWTSELLNSVEWRKRFKSDERLFWRDVFVAVEMGKIESWAYQWQACIWLNNGNSITPSVNMITNIGFEETATNTVDRSNRLANMQAEVMKEIVEPESLELSREKDRYVFEWAYLGGVDPTIWLVKRSIKKAIRYLLRMIGRRRGSGVQS